MARSKNPKIEKIGRVSTTSVLKCTGRDWDEWVAILEKAGARNLEHKDIVLFLRAKYKPGPWWEQVVATCYEMHLGKKVEGRSSKGFYSTASTKTLPLDQKKLWKFMTSAQGLAIWLKPMAPVKIEKGAVFESEFGAFGEIRTLKAPERIRLSWRESDEGKASILMVLMHPRKGEKSLLIFQHDQLPNARLRLQMKSQWMEVLGYLADAVISPANGSGTSVQRGTRLGPRSMG